jgi:group I intron endonuclease
MPDYSKAKIYRLVCNITGKQYIGSTCYTLSQRKAKHVYEAKKQNKYIRSKDVIDGGNYSIILVENYPCNNIDELKQRERYFIETIECVNFAIPASTRKEVEQRHRETEKYKETTKKYEENNKEKIKERQQKYRDEHREELSKKACEYGTKRVVCDCGLELQRGNLLKHKKRKAHLEWEKNLRN